MTAYVIDGLTLAKQAGYEVDEERLARGREKLQEHARKRRTTKREDKDSRAYMVYALTESGGVDRRSVEKLFAERNNLQPYGARDAGVDVVAQKMDQRASKSRKRSNKART